MRLLPQLILALCLFVAPALGQSTKIETKSAALSAPFSYSTTSLGAGVTGCLSHVAINFSAAPTAIETAKIYLKSRNGTAGNSLIGKADTIAAVTLNLTFFYSNSVPLNSGDQLTITVTNNSTNATVTATAWADTSGTPCVGDGLSILRDGQVITGTAFGSITAVGSCSTGDCAKEGGTDIFPFIYEGTANTFETTFQVTDPTADNIIIFPNYGGTVVLAGTVPADDKVPVGDSATSVTWRSVPDCVDTAGNHLNYTAATNSFSCGLSAGVATPHNLLSATHSDTTAASATRGDLITAQGASPLWARLAKGTQYQTLQGGATEAGYDAVHLDQPTAITGTLGHANGGTDVTAVTDDTILVGSGTLWVSTALPSCSAAGSVLRYTTASNALSCATLADADIPDTITLTNLTQIGTRQISDTTGTLLEPRGGTGESTYTVGDILYSDAANSLAKLAGNITATKKWLSGTGTGSAAQAPVWDTLADSDVPDTITLTNITQIGTRPHSSLTSLTSGDDHTQYALLAGRSSGQTLYGGTAASEKLTLAGTIHATVGAVIVNPSGGGMAIGTTTTGGFDFVTSNNTTRPVSIFEGAGDTPAGAIFATRKSRGTVASPTAISVGDILGEFDFNGYTDAYKTGASFIIRADTGYGTSGNDAPAYIQIWTTPDGSATAVERIRVLSGGGLRFVPQATAPASPSSGDCYMDSSPTPDEFCCYDGAAWQGLTSGTDANCA